MHRTPPAFDPAQTDQYPFRYWMQDIMAWMLLATDLEPAQQCAAIILELRGAARDLCRDMTYADLTQGGMIGGQQVDPPTLLLSHLTQKFAPLGEEQRLKAMTDMMHFTRLPGESIDQLQARFQSTRFRARTGNTGLDMS